MSLIFWEAVLIEVEGYYILIQFGVVELFSLKSFILSVEFF